MGTDIHIVAEVFKEGRWHLSDMRPSDNRNYRAFAVLADVRNGYGFGGFDTGDRVTPISEPRGLPEDMSPELLAKLERADTGESIDMDDDEEGGWCWLGEHSFSWVTLKELLEYDLDAPVKVRGYVSEEQAKRFREKGELPNSWAAWTPQPGFERIEWQMTLRNSAPLISTLIDEIKNLGEPEHVRLVFGFDS